MTTALQQYGRVLGIGTSGGGGGSATDNNVASITSYAGTGSYINVPLSATIADTATTAWAANVGATTDTCAFNGVCSLSNGDVVAVGYANAASTISEIMRVTATGVLVWQRGISNAAALEAAYCVAADSSDNVYVGGTHRGSAKNEISVSKFDTTGALVWQRGLIPVGTGTAIAQAIAVDNSSGAVYVAGQAVQGSVANGFLAKYDLSGVLQWQRVIGGGSTTIVYGCAVDSTGAVIVSGGQTAGLVFKYSSAGAVVWKITATGAGSTVLYAITTDSTNNIYLAGWTGISGDSYPSGLIIKLNSSGVVQWNTALKGGSQGNVTGGAGISLDTNNNVFATFAVRNMSYGVLSMLVTRYTQAGTLTFQANLDAGGGQIANTALTLAGSTFNSNTLYLAGRQVAVGGNAAANGVIVSVPALGLNTGDWIGDIKYIATVMTSKASGVTVAASAVTEAAGAMTATSSFGSSVTPTLPFAVPHIYTAKQGTDYLLWVKGLAATDHTIMDTARAVWSPVEPTVSQPLTPAATTGATPDTTGVSALRYGSFTAHASSKLNTSGASYVAYAFKETAEVFDIVTYTGNSIAARAIPHNLTVTPGLVIVKAITAGSNWAVYHSSAVGDLFLNTTAVPAASHTTITAVSASTFTVGNGVTVNQSGTAYVAYAWAATSDDCQTGSCSSGTAVVTPWEPMLVLFKRTDAAGDWIMMDNMQGCYQSTTDKVWKANLTNAQLTGTEHGRINADGFVVALTGTFVYLAVKQRRVQPLFGKQVFNAVARTGTNAAARVTGVGFAPDSVHSTYRAADIGIGTQVYDRLNSNEHYVKTAAVGPQIQLTPSITSFDSDGMSLAGANINVTARTYIDRFFKRAPGFFDITLDTGTGIKKSVPHQLATGAQLMMRICLDAAIPWTCYVRDLGGGKNLILNSNAAAGTDTNRWDNAEPDQHVFFIGADAVTNQSGVRYLTYLFASCPGVSSTGLYAGDGTSSQNLSCGFAAGARYIMIKRVDAAGDWYFWDSVRGITAGNDPHLSLNTTLAEVASDNSVDQYNLGFTVNQNATTNLNAATGIYLYLAIS